MCGVVGGINISIENLEKMQNALIHRGPDSGGNLIDKNILLGHRRLAIQDIDNGIQPLSISSYTIVFNGEIYNHQKIRKRFLSNVDFRTSSDTETLIYLYANFREKMFDMIDGMFSFCIHDKKRNKLIIARDRAGKKPLYFFNDRKTFIFSSELNSIKNAIPEIKINNDAIYFYLRCGFMFKDHTPYKNIKSVKPGYWYNIDIETLNVSQHKYFDIKRNYKNKSQSTFNEKLNYVDHILHKSIKNRLISSDLEVGAFLSGGIDSSLVVAIASHYKKNLKTFTVKFDGDYDESHLAKLTSDRYSTDHHELKISYNLENDLEKILTNYGQPFMDSSAIPSYYVSQAAKKHVTVALNGDGADELFGGYRRYVPFSSKHYNHLSKISWLKYFLPFPRKKNSLYNYFHRLLNISMKSGINHYLSTTTDIFEDFKTFEKNKIFYEMQSFIESIDLNPVEKLQYLDFRLLLASNLLVKMDISTMSQSLEGRSPFLSKYFLDFAPKLNTSDRIRGGKTKFILRELSKKYLDETICIQPKRGFESPISKWIDNEIKSIVCDYLYRDSFSSKFIDKNFILNLIDNKISISSEKRAKIIWTLLTLEIWHEKIIKA
tara:strand:+ start:151 stop:1962 length:1812 start_codon:yes stop_codon:yes gene_type:complete